MTENFLTGLLYISMLAVVIVLVLGIVNLYRTGDKARSNSNKLMRLRVALQFGAILIILGIYYVKEQMGT